MVRADDVNRPIGQALTDRLHVLGSAQGRVDLVERIVGASEFLREEQVVRGRFGGDLHSHFLAPADELH